MTPAVRAAVLLALAGHLCAPAALAQRGGTEPLRKVELVRLLGSRAMSTAQVAVLVRRNCVAFRPSERDRADLRAAGADDAVLTAIDQCLRARAPASRPAPRPSVPVSRPTVPTPPRVTQQPAPRDTQAAQAPPPAPPRAPPPPPPARPVPAPDLTQFTRGAGQHAPVGSALPLVLEVRDSTGAPIAKQPVAFAVSGGAVTPTAAETDATGTVRVRVALPERAGPVEITAKVGTFSRTATVYADPGPAHELVVERGGAPAGHVAVRSRDTVAVRVVARDGYGNRTRLEDFMATTSGRSIGLMAAAASDSQALVTLAPRRSGLSELQLSASGLHARVTVDVALPATARPWAIGARSAWLGANNPWINAPSLAGISGADVTFFGRRLLPGATGVSLALGAEAGSLSADRAAGGTVSMTLVEAFGRAELAVFADGPVSPVVSLGAGAYHLKSDDNGQAVYHTNAFWAGGGGLDVAVSPRLTVEVRVERQWMRAANQGHVATFWPMGAGARIALYPAPYGTVARRRRSTTTRRSQPPRRYTCTRRSARRRSTGNEAQPIRRRSASRRSSPVRRS